MAINKNPNNILLEGRTDDNLKFTCEADYDITAYPLSFLVETNSGVIDLSQYCIKTSAIKFTVDVPSSVMAGLEAAVNYKVGVKLDANNRDFFFGGKMIIKKGILL